MLLPSSLANGYDQPQPPLQSKRRGVWVVVLVCPMRSPEPKMFFFHTKQKPNCLFFGHGKSVNFSKKKL